MKTLFLEHPRLWLSVFVGAALFFCLPHGWPPLMRILLCWNASVMLFITLVVFWMTGLTAQEICLKYVEEDEGAPIILFVVVIAALLSLFAIIQPLATIKEVSGLERAAHFGLAALTLINSWVLVPIMFTTHYADLFYSAAASSRPLRFPKTAMPVFWDFAYFSFTIAAACQTADVATLHAEIRKIVLAQTLVSFLFNVSILGFAINVTAGLIGSN